MTNFRAVLVILGIFLFSQAYAIGASFSDRNFKQDRMIITNSSVIVLSPFEEQDHLTAYNDYGTLLWDVTVNSKVISWKIRDGLLFVFSKSRYLEKTYLTCVDPATGYIFWERP